MSGEMWAAGRVGRRELLGRGAKVAVGVGVLGIGVSSAQVAVAAPEAGDALTRSGIPDGPVAREAMRLAREASSETLFNHVMRTYLYGVLLFERPGVRFDREMLFVACMLHDLGLVERYRSPAERFELDGADAAARFLRERRVSAERVDLVWDAIALHTNVSIAVRKRPEIAAVAAGAVLDVAGQGLDRVDPGAVAEVLAAYPRLGFKEDAVRTMVELCRTKPMAQFAHPFVEVGRRHIPGFAVPTIEDAVNAAPFAE